MRARNTPSQGQPLCRPFGCAPGNLGLGFRNPWRFSFDSLTGALWLADVGQDRVEEVDVVRRGENYGWNVFEAFEPFSNKYRRAEANYTPPVFAYRRKYGNSSPAATSIAATKTPRSTASIFVVITPPGVFSA